MKITVRFPSMLHSVAGRERIVDAEVNNLGALLAALDRLVPGISEKLADPIYNYAVNDELLLHGVQNHTVHDGDIVEIVPTISGG
jgi:molybdopterin converting factor small subunit